VPAEEVGDGGYLVGLLEVGGGAREGGGAGFVHGGGLEGVLAEEALVDYVVAVAEEVCFVGGWGEERRLFGCSV
jgi:hypothetical protein